MMDRAAWEEANSHYLSAALQWVRLRLEQRANELNPRNAGNSAEVDALGVAAKEMARVESEMESAPALVRLSQRLGLSHFEQIILLLCAAVEFDTTITTLCARAQGDSNRAYPTFALALSLFDQPAWDTLSPERPLRYWKLIEINQPGAQALTTSPLRADERIVNYLKGLDYLDDRLAPYLAPAEFPESLNELPLSQQELLEKITCQWRQVRTHSLFPVIQLLGPDTNGKQMLASLAAAVIGRRLYRMSLDALPSQPADLEILARLWQRESMLLPIALYLDAHELGALASDSQTLAVRRFLARSDGAFVLGVREACVLDVTKPTTAEQRDVWAEVIGADDAGAPALLASQFNLNLGDIRQIGQSVKSEDAPGENTLPERIWDACRDRVRPLLNSLAQRLDPKATWDDIVLPSEEMDLLRQLAGQVNRRSKVYEDWGFARRMNRGLGITALFAGDSGTGKTMAAEVIANDLRLNLYRIDLSAVVSKYIGETEKNLRRLFDAAEDGGAILFFDEADALFGKRSEVKDSHDRYANIEVNYLLQRMEGYRGLAILATNMRSAMDIAFTRRLRFIVNFPFPGTADRRRMWQKAFPRQTPTRQLDYDRLSRLNLTGGGIHNAALNAAFLAAQAGTQVTMAVVLAAARSEFIKLDRPINEADFRSLEPAEVVA
jgi:hypothetical protein